MADVIFGDYNPSGKLSVTFYKNDAQLPDYEDYSMKGRTYRYFNDPLFAFGYGLSYTTFEIGDAAIDGKDGNYQVTIPVSNTGQKDGTEIVQLYIRDLADKEGPLKESRTDCQGHHHARQEELRVLGCFYQHHAHQVWAIRDSLRLQFARQGSEAPFREVLTLIHPQSDEETD